MADNVSGLFEWGKGLSNAASGAGFPMAAVPESTDLKDFVVWAKGITVAVGAMISLPTLADDADYAACLGWAKTLDTAARAMLPSLPALPS